MNELIEKNTDQGPDVARESAHLMANVMESSVNYIGGEPYVSKEGMDKLIDLFGEVPDDLKAAAFEVFLDELAKRDIDYDITQFVENA